MRVSRSVWALIGAMALGLVMAGPVAANQAGKVLFAVGDVSATNAAGQSRPLRRGATLFSGDLIATKRGRAQLSFTDGGRVSLSPESEFQIEEYKFDGQADGTERGFFSFLKGGLRVLTGLVGKKNRSNYRVRTPVATIGIRGTWFNATLLSLSPGAAPILQITVGDDPNDPTSIILSNNGGELVVERGGSATVQDEDTAPQPSNEPVVLGGAPPSTGEEPIFVAGDERNEEGSQVVIDEEFGNFTTLENLIGVDAIGSQVVVPAEPEPIAEVGAFQSAFLALNDGLPILGVGVDASFEPEGSVGLITTSPVLASALVTELQEFVSNADEADLADFQANPASTADFTQTNGLTWFRWTNGNILGLDVNTDGSLFAEVDQLTGNQSQHIIAGPPPTSMPSPGANLMATYDFIGGTASSTKSGNGPTGAGITMGTLTAYFVPSPFVGVNLYVDHGGGTYMVNGSVDISENFFSDQIGGSVYATGSSSAGTACTSLCAVNLNGFFSGDNAPGTAPPAAGIAVLIQETDPILTTGGFVKAGEGDAAF